MLSHANVWMPVFHITTVTDDFEKKPIRYGYGLAMFSVIVCWSLAANHAHKAGVNGILTFLILIGALYVLNHFWPEAK